MYEEKLVETVNGYPTFNDVKDRVLRNKNRGNILVNIVEDCTLKKMSSAESWEAVKNYLNNIPKEDYLDVFSSFHVAALIRTHKN